VISTELVKAGQGGRLVTTSSVKERREANKEHLEALRGQMLGVQVRLANSVLSGSKRDRDVVARLRGEIALAEDADRALELAEVLAELRDTEALQKQLMAQREPRLTEKKTLRTGYDILDRPGYTIAKQERLKEIRLAMHEVDEAINAINEQIESADRRSLELQGRFRSMAPLAQTV
jgi:hypothetical protein